MDEIGFSFLRKRIGPWDKISFISTLVSPFCRCNLQNRPGQGGRFDRSVKLTFDSLQAGKLDKINRGNNKVTREWVFSSRGVAIEQEASYQRSFAALEMGGLLAPDCGAKTSAELKAAGN